MREISWSELVTLMLHGPDLPTRGRLRRVLPAGAEDEIGWSRHDGVPVPPPFARGVDVVMWGPRLRLTDAGGRVTLVSDGTTAWTFDPDSADAPPRESPLEEVELGLGGTDVLLRTTARRLLDTELATTPEPTPTTYAGRAAWAATLTPKPRRRGSAQLVVDAETGQLLQRRNDEHGESSEWEDIEIGVDLDPSIFGWDGPALTWEQQLADVRRDGERRQAEWEERTGRWTREELGITSVSVTLDLDLLVRSREDDGTLHVDLGDLGTLGRRPRSDAPWHEFDAPSWEGFIGSCVRWQDDRWDWAVLTHSQRLSDDAVQAIRTQLERSVRG